MAVKLLRTIRLDASDTFVFERAAASGEIAVPGAFLFWGDDLDALEGKRRTAFRAGFLGIASFGFSTLAIVAEADAAEYAAAVERLAEQLVTHMGAPDLATARPAAAEEIAFAASLADHPTDTFVALHRSAEGGEIRERFRTLRPGRPVTEVRAFSFVEVDDAAEAPQERIDLAGLVTGRVP